MKILIIEDEAELLEVTTEALRAEGFVVESAMDFGSAMEKLGVYKYDCVLLDVMLPGGSGFDILSKMKAVGDRTNVIITSAKGAIEDKVKGLELGADDYLAKPFYISELVARIRSVVRRSLNDGNFAMTFGNVSLEPDCNRVTVGGREVQMLKKEFDILRYFLQRPGHVVDKEVLAEAVWGDHIDQVDDFQFVYAQMKNLRRKLADSGADIEIKSIYGFGYKMVEKA